MELWMQAKFGRFVLVLCMMSLIVAYFFLGWDAYFTLDFLRSRQAVFQSYYQEHQLETLLIYFLVYVLTTALSLPGATVLTLAGGALFGLGLGLVVISFASTIGATCAFLVARFLLRDSIQARYGDRLTPILEGFQREGSFYLFTLRLVPLFPFFMINLLMGLTPMKTRAFYWVSQLGMLPGTAVYVNAGTQLAQIESLSGILSPKLLVSFALLGIFPLLAKRIVSRIRRGRKVL
jgi:uncharacterized membrane protein YdjX (TVP38/TMEM64 family)